MNEKTISLFIHEAIYILYGDSPIITDNFIDNLNTYIYFNRKNYQESFSLLFDMDLLDKFYKTNKDLLSMDLVMYLIIKYSSDIAYATLVEEVGLEIDQKINELSLNFASYCELSKTLDSQNSSSKIKILH